MKLSVIIPVYNVAKYIEQCLMSVLNQTIDDMEVLLVDDCGTDNSIEIIENIIKNYTGDISINILHHKKNRGLSAARNTGIEAAKGEYISFVDSDDYISPNMMEQLLNELEGNSTCGISSCSPVFVNEVGDVINNNFLYNSEELKVVEPQDFFVKWFTSQIWYTAWGKIYKKDLFDSVRFHEGINNEDMRLCIDIYKEIEKKQYKLIEIPQKLYFYRQREGSITKETKKGTKTLNFDIVTNNSVGIKILKEKDPEVYSNFVRTFCQSWWGIIIQIRQYRNLFKYYHHYQKMAKLIPNDVAEKVLNKYGKEDYSLFRNIKYFPMFNYLSLIFSHWKAKIKTKIKNKSN